MRPDAQWDCFAVAMTTRQGYPLAAGGICRRGTAPYWKERFRALASLKVARDDAFSIDRDIANALQELAEDTLPVAGCTLDAGPCLPPGERSGGVLGCPYLPARSAADASEPLPEGFSLYAAAGGPGLAALADPEVTARAIAAIRALAPTASADTSGATISDCLRSFGLSTFLFVSDGTGADTPGRIIAACPGSLASAGLDIDARG